MKYVAIVVVSLFGSRGISQVRTGTYQSVNPSFRENFFLVVERDKVYLFGWELNDKKDTICYRSVSRFERNGQVKFHRFAFSRLSLNKNTLRTFSPRKDLQINSLLVHTRLFNVKQVDDQLFLSATKDSYDSRADEFVFKRIR